MLKEPVGKLYLKYLIPSLLGALATSVYSIVDTIAVGQYAGPDGSAAIAIINPLFAIFCFLGLLFGIGASVLMSNAKGEGSKENADRIFSSSIILIAISSLAIWILTWVFLDPLLVFFGADETLLPLARSYSDPIMSAFPLFVANNYLPPILRYDEKPGLAMKGVLAGGVINIFLDWFLVFPLDMGMKGAGLATAIGAFTQTAIILSHFYLKRSSLRIHLPARMLHDWARIAASGFGASILDVAIGALTIMINRQTMRYGGHDELAVLGVIMTISFLLQHLYAGIGQAVQPIASVSYGAGRKDRVWLCYRYMAVTSIAFGAASMLLACLFPAPILRLFINVTDSVLAIGPHIIRIYSLSFLLMALNINIVFFLQSILKPFPALMISLSRGVVVSSLLLFILPLVMGMDGILWAMAAAEIVTAGAALPYIRKARQETSLNGSWECGA